MCAIFVWTVYPRYWKQAWKLFWEETNNPVLPAKLQSSTLCALWIKVWLFRIGFWLTNNIGEPREFFTPLRCIQIDWVDKFTSAKADNLPSLLANTVAVALNSSTEVCMRTWYTLHYLYFLSYGRLGEPPENKRKKSSIKCSYFVSCVLKLFVKCFKL